MINKALSLLDYIFFRSYLFYKKYNDNDPVFMSVLIVSLFFVLYTIIFLSLCNHFIEFGYYKKSEKRIVRILITGIILIVIFINSFIYNKKKVKIIIRRWEDEGINVKKRRGKIIVFLLIFPVIIGFVYGALKHNLHWL